MSRSKWKPNFISYQKKEVNNTSELWFKKRSIKINPSFVDSRIYIYNGMRWVNFEVNRQMLYQSVGEFAPTRKRPIPKKKKLKKK